MESIDITKQNWQNFKEALPHQKLPYSKRNWGHSNHSLCSYQGKLKPSIANHLIQAFVPSQGSVLDPFSGVGTIPFEAGLAGKKGFGFDISLPAYYISVAKVSQNSLPESIDYINHLQLYIQNHFASQCDLDEAKTFGFNKKVADYYHENTLAEILLAKEFLKISPPDNSSKMLVVSALLHILHGNRPYALSRNSHPIVPYAPTGDFEYKSLINNVYDKVLRTFKEKLPDNFVNGEIFFQDATAIWPENINNLDAIVTSPPFFDSTRFYLANWLRIWFSGWDAEDFRSKPKAFVEERQKNSFDIYTPIFEQAKERLKKDGLFVLHLGKSKKCDMALELGRVSKKWFKTFDIFDESVSHCESHGIRDKGTVTSHQYLVLH